MRTTKLLNALLLMAATALAACQHDDGEALLTLRGENLCRPQKMTVVDSTASWNQGDTVWINGERYTVNIDGEGRATTRVRRADSYSAIFPASIVTNDNNVRLPHEYHYSSDVQGRQQIDLPMMASSEGEGLAFFHLTGAVMVKFVNHRSETVTVDRITVKSDAFALSGNRPIDFADTAQAPLPIASPTDSSVTVLFDRHPVQVAFDDTLAVLVPVAPVGNTNHFTVEVVTHIDGRRYTIRNTQRNAHPNPRNALAYAYMWLTDTCRSFSLFHEDGNGANRTMHISSASDFLLFQQAINNGWTHDGTPYSTFKYTIDANIDMSGCEIEPINGFTGTSFNGNGHTISNLTISSQTSCCALFDSVTNCIISNLKLPNITLICGSEVENISPFVAKAHQSTFINCSTTISAIEFTESPTGTINFGGFAAITGGAITLDSCNIVGTANINSGEKIYFGGLVGALKKDVLRKTLKATSCNIEFRNVRLLSTTGVVAGGIIGDSQRLQDSIKRCTLFIQISTSTSSGYIRAGGLVGTLNMSNQNPSTLHGQNDTIRGYIQVENGSYNIGTIYGRGRAPQYYDYSTCDVTDLDIPDKINHHPAGTY